MYKCTLYKCALTLQPACFLCAHPSLRLSLAFPWRRGSVCPTYMRSQQSILQSLLKQYKYAYTTVQHPAGIMHFLLKSVSFSWCGTAMKFENLSVQGIALLTLVPDWSRFAPAGDCALRGLSMCAGRRVCTLISPNLVLPVSAWPRKFPETTRKLHPWCNNQRSTVQFD